MDEQPGRLDRAARRSLPSLGEQAFNEVAVDIGKSIIAALEAVGESSVFEPEAMEESGLEVVDVDWVIDDVESEIIGRAEDRAAADAPAGHPDRERFSVVVSTVVFIGSTALCVRGSAKLTAEHDQCVLEQAALFEVGDEPRGGAIDLLTDFGHSPAEVTVHVPVAMIELDESDVSFSEPPSEQAVAGVGSGLIDLGTVEFANVLGFRFQVGQLGHAELHAAGHLVLADAGFDFGIADVGKALAVELGDSLEHRRSLVGGHPWRIGEVEDGLAATTEGDPLESTWEETAAPESREQALAGTGFGDGNHDHEGGQVGVEGAEAVIHPGTEAGSTGLLASGLEEGDGWIVIDGLGVHRADEAEVVGDGPRVGEHFTDGDPGLAAGLEGILAGLKRESGLGCDHAGDALTFSDGVRKVLIEPFA